MNVLGCKIEKVDDFRLEEDEAERLLIRIKKCKGTPKLYPRKAGTPSKILYRKFIEGNLKQV